MTHLSDHEIEQIETLATRLADKVQAFAFSTRALARSLPPELAEQMATRIALSAADASAAQLRALIAVLVPALTDRTRGPREAVPPGPVTPCGCQHDGRAADQPS